MALARTRRRGFSPVLRAEFTALAAFCGTLLPGWRARLRRALLKTCCCASRLNRAAPPGAAGALGVPALARPAGAAVALLGLGVELSPIPGWLAAGLEVRAAAG